MNDSNDETLTNEDEHHVVEADGRGRSACPAESGSTDAAGAGASGADAFAELGVGGDIIRALKAMGFGEPTPVQSACIPFILAGRDIIGQARTGTGKTAAFGVPMVQMLPPRGGDEHTAGLVLTPTRELCCQVAEELRRIGSESRMSVVPVFGGQPIHRQLDALEQGRRIVVGTPGRTMDLMRRGHLDFRRLRMLVLDEADEMLDMGFIDDIRWIVGHTPKKRQTLLFSATMPRPIRRLAEFYMNEPMMLDLSRDSLAGEGTEQFFFEVDEDRKFEALCDLIDHERVGLGLVFCRTKASTRRVGARLRGRGFDAHVLHGDLSQAERTRVMKKFRDRDMHLLVATDVAARGIDVSNVTHVINYELPRDPELYIHRIGRTGRIGRRGRALTLVTQSEFFDLHAIQEKLDVEIPQGDLPSRRELEDRRRAEELRAYLAEAGEGDLSPYLRLMEDVEDFLDIKEVAAVLFKLLHDTRCGGGRHGMFGHTGASRPGLVRFRVAAGRRDGLTQETLVDRLSSLSAMAAELFGNIRIHDEFSYVELPLANAAVFYERLLDHPDEITVEPATERSRDETSRRHRGKEPDRRHGRSRRDTRRRRSGRKSVTGGDGNEQDGADRRRRPDRDSGRPRGTRGGGKGTRTRRSRNGRSAERADGD